MTPYWQGFVAGGLTFTGAWLALSVIVLLAFARRLRGRDGIEP